MKRVEVFYIFLSWNKLKKEQGLFLGHAPCEQRQTMEKENKQKTNNKQTTNTNTATNKESLLSGFSWGTHLVNNVKQLKRKTTNKQQQRKIFLPLKPRLN